MLFFIGSPLHSLRSLITVKLTGKYYNHKSFTKTGVKDNRISEIALLVLNFKSHALIEAHGDSLTEFLSQLLSCIALFVSFFLFCFVLFYFVLH